MDEEIVLIDIEQQESAAAVGHFGAAYSCTH